MAVLNRRGFGGKKTKQGYFAQLNLNTHKLAARVRLAWPAEEHVSLARLS